MTHPKILCSERSSPVASANVIKNSIAENFGIKIFTGSNNMVDNVSDILEFMPDTKYTRWIPGTEQI